MGWSKQTRAQRPEERHEQIDLGERGLRAVDLGGTATGAVMETPGRHDAVYGEEYRTADAHAVVDAAGDGAAIPPTSRYG